MKMTTRRFLCALATIALAGGLGACADEDALIDALERNVGDAGTDDVSRGGTGGDASGGEGNDAGGNPSLDVGIGGEDTSGGGVDAGGGTDTGYGCREIVDCVNGTNGTESAINACVAAGSSGAQTLYAATDQCVRQNCAEEARSGDQAAFTACQQEFCRAELQACSDDTTGGGETPVGDVGAYAECDGANLCQANMDCMSLDGASFYCMPRCGAGGACLGWDGGAGACGITTEGSATATNCLPLCADTEASTDCPPGWTCAEEQGVTLCSP